MKYCRSTTRYSQLLIRIAVVAFVFLLGHDALMAVGSNHASEGLVDHHPPAVAQCHTPDITTHHANVGPSFPDMDVTATTRSADWLIPAQHTVSEPNIPARDASTLRAFLQVYLN